MGVAAEIDELRAAVASTPAVVAKGGGTHWEVGGPPPRGTEVRAPHGVVSYDPADLTVTVAAGTSVEELAAVLGEAGQECVLDPRSPHATVGGLLATGLSGHRRLRYGPLRDRVLEVRFVTADGRLVKGGGPTVKNVSGYDVPRLLVGSFGTLGVLVQVILRCQPVPAMAEWSATADDPLSVRARAFRPSCVAWDGRSTHVLLEGDPHDVEAERRAVGSEVVPGPPSWPDGPHRGRISVRPAAVPRVGHGLAELPGVAFLAEVGVGTVHVAADTEAGLAAARRLATQEGGWLLREVGAPGLDGFGCTLPNLAVMRRLRDAFDPAGKLARGRLPFDEREIAPSDVETAMLSTSGRGRD
jgi:FAD/FMN-containing dehydrogenase